MKQVAGFEILGKLGQGGMGAVFKARQSTLDRIVALKILPPDIAKDATFIERFQREARASARLNHPHIVQGIDVGQDPATGLWYFAMEFVDGPSLRKVLDEQKHLPEERALEIVRQITLALEVVNANGMVHRDIKPDNILLSPEGEAKLADLGLAKKIDEDTALTQAGLAVGSPYYMPPELARGKSDECDIRTDIYSLGATLFHLVTGQPPFTGETGAVIMAKHLTEQPPKASKVNPAVSDACSRLIDKMMQKKPAQRVQTPAALLAQIDKIRTGEQPGGARRAVHRSTAPRAPANERSREGESRRSNPAVIISVVAAVIVLVGVAAFALMGRNDTTPTPARKETVAQPPPERTVPEQQKSNQPVTAIGPTVTLPAPPPGPDPRELFKTAQAFEHEHPAAWDEAVQRYRQASLAAKGTQQEAALEKQVSEALAALNARRESAAASAWEATEKQVTVSAASGDYDGALALLKDAPSKIGQTMDGPINQRTQALTHEANDRVEAILKKAEALAATDPKTALEALAEAQKIKFAPAQERIRELTRKLEDARVAAATPKVPDPAALEHWSGLLQRFDEALLEARDLKAAANLATQAQTDPVLKPFSRQTKALSEVMAAFDDVARFELDELAKLVGQKIDLDTATGPLSGTFGGIRDGQISIKIQIGAGAEAEKKVKLTDIPEAQRKKLTPPFQPGTDAQRMAVCYTLLAKGTRDVPSALKLLEGAADFPLTSHVLALAEAVKSGKEKAQAEAAAPAAWSALQTRTQAPNLNEADAHALLKRLDTFEAEFGKTDFAAAHREEIEAGRTRVWRVLHPNIVVNGDFEKNSWDGWQRGGGSLSSQITTDHPHDGKYALYIDMQRDYNATLSQTLTVEPKAEYRVSCWIKYLKGSLEQGRGGLFVIEGDGERRFDENRGWLPLLPKVKAGEWVKVEMKYVPQSPTVRLELFLRQTSIATERYYLQIDDIEFARCSK